MSITGFTGRPLETIQSDATISAATTITPATDADYIMLEASTQNIRITLNGETPTASSGFLLAKDTVYAIDCGQDVTIKVIEVTASASVQWQSFRRIKDTDV